MGTQLKYILSLICLIALPALGAEAIKQPGADVDELLTLAQAQNPELATMRHEADAAGERIEAVGALPDPSFRISLQDFTNKASGAATTLVPSEVGSTYYRVMQPVPFWGKRDLKQEIAIAEASATEPRHMGQVMKLLLPRLQGRATGEQASQAVRKLLIV